MKWLASLIPVHAVLLVAAFAGPAGAAVIDSGERPSSSISIAGEVDDWTFSATTGDAIVARVTRLNDNGSHFDPKIQLYAPDGVTLLTYDSDSIVAEVAITAASTGNFTLRITDGSNYNLAGTGNYRLQLMRVPSDFAISDDGGVLNNGYTQDATIDSGDIDPWTFTANSGDNIILRVTELLDDGHYFDPKIRLYSPTGSLLASTSDSGVVEVAINANVTGKFTVLVSDGSNYDLAGTGTYRVQVMMLPGDIHVTDDGAALSNGQTQDATIDLGDVDPWTFTANSGDNIVLRVTELLDNGHYFDPKIRLYAPSGALLASTSDSGVVEVALKANATGKYTVLVSDGSNYDLDGTGNYRIQLIMLPGEVLVTDDGGSLANGQTYDATMPLGDVDPWTFTANSGDNIILRVTELLDSGHYFDPKIRLYAPNGSLLASSSDSGVVEVAIAANATGKYTVLVSDGSNYDLSGSGNYRIQLIMLPGDVLVTDDGGALTNGQNHDATIELGDVDPWTFTANSGDSIVLRIAELLDGGHYFDPKIRLYAPNGSLLASDSDSGVVEIAFTANAAGTYTVLVSDGSNYDLDGTGDYRLQFARIPGDFVTADDGGMMVTAQNHDGTITIGDLDRWSFAATAGDSIDLRIAELTDDGHYFDPKIRLYAPDGTFLQSASNSQVAEIVRTVSATGVYTVLVSDGSSYDLAGTGTYRLTVFGAVPCADGQLCRNAVGDCDAEETCSNYVCPPNVPKPAGSPCPSDLNPCTTDTCNGVSNSCQHAAGNAGTECRASSGSCDPHETCTGTSASCPVNALANTITVCRASAGSCDVEERCSGSLANCPADTLLAAATVCRSSAGICDLAESCTGSSAACPGDIKSTAVCRAAAGVCDPSESCNGVADSCPSDAKSIAVCRSSTGICDPAESCSGSSNACPVDSKSTSMCRVASGVCDVAEFCNGSSGSCPADAKSVSACRASAGVCDPAETCSGSSDACPADTRSSSLVVCRASLGVCDPVETCSGSGTECPLDLYSSQNSPCGSDGNGCTNDVCSGASPECQHQANSVPCNDGSFCNGSDTCSDGSCTLHSGNPCGGADGDGNCKESCNEATDSCTAADPSGSQCNDDIACTSDDVCLNGICKGVAGPECSTTTTTLLQSLCGDANDDGDITAGDALSALRTAVGNGSCPAFLCDYSGDGKVTAGDALAILRRAVGENVPARCPAAFGLDVTTTQPEAVTTTTVSTDGSTD